MKKPSIEALLIAARPDKGTTDSAFTSKVMHDIKQAEIFSKHMRTMNVTKKETFSMKIRRLPTLAIVAIALGALLLVSGSAYAAYQLLWQKPEVHVSEPTTSVTGRDEVAISFAQCGSDHMAKRYELKKGAPITIDQVPMVVKARCELQAIETWVRSTFPSDEPGMGGTEPYDATSVYVAMATHVKSFDTSSITFEGLTKYNQVDASFTVSDDVRYVVDGKEVPRSDIKVGDPVVYVLSRIIHMTPEEGCDKMHCSISGEPVSEKLVAVVKLSQPFEYYDQLAWQSLAEREACFGNPDDTCLTGYVGGIDIHLGSASPDESRIMKQIHGVVTQIDGGLVTIRSSSGTLFTIEIPNDAVRSYNEQRAPQYYNNQKVVIGSSLMVMYVEANDQHSKQISASQLNMVQLQIELISKGDPVRAY